MNIEWRVEQLEKKVEKIEIRLRNIEQKIAVLIAQMFIIMGAVAYLIFV